jgi:hypothetical protein
VIARSAFAALGSLALAAAMLPLPAHAQSEDLLECSFLKVTPAFREKIAMSMLSDETVNETESMMDTFADIASQCATANKLDPAKMESYFTYSLARLPRETYVDKLGEQGVPATVIDDTLGFGAGRANPVITGSLSEAQVTALLSALAATGLDTDKVSDETWAMVGAYAATTSLMWQSLAKLR